MYIEVFDENAERGSVTTTIVKRFNEDESETYQLIDLDNPGYGLCTTGA